MSGGSSNKEEEEGDGDSGHDILPWALRRPTAADLFENLLTYAEEHLPPPLLSKKRAATGIPAHAPQVVSSSSSAPPPGGTAWRLMVQQLLGMFEYFFLDYVLYPEELELLQQQLKRLGTQQVNFADEFNAYYFLRFLVLVATSASEDDLQAVAGAGTSGGSNRGSSAAGNKRAAAGVPTGTACTTAAVGPQSAAYEAMQSLLQAAFNMLNEQPQHLIFY